MIDNKYQDAFKEVWDILQNTDDKLVAKIPKKFIDFLHKNMNNEYKTNIQNNVPIDKQSLLKETEAVLSLIYRSYWATDEEKIEFANKDKKELEYDQQIKKQSYKNVDEIFNRKTNINKVTIDNNLMVIPKQSFFKKFINKLLKFLGKKGM